MPAIVNTVVGAGVTIFGAAKKESREDERMRLQMELAQKRQEFERELATTQNYQQYYMKLNQANQEFQQNLATLNKPNYLPVMIVAGATVLSVYLITRKSD